MAHSTLSKIAAAVVIVLIFVMMGSCLVPLAHGATTHPRANSLGLSQSYQNPYVYMFGSIEHVDSFSNMTNVVFKPFGASLLDTESILFCGDLEKQLDEATEMTLYVVTYRVQATRLYKGVPCHEVYRILQLGVTK